MSSDPSTQGTGRNIRIGKYEILAHIASGGMGAVYRAFDTENSREVALKVMTPEMASKPAMLERFRREARSGLKLQHENVVSLYEFGEANGTCFLAMEFITGIDLHEHIDRRGTLDPEESRQIMIQAARALSHAYKQGIVHRDIKPSNFLIAEKDGHLRVKLTDLGLAREASNEEFRVTRSGTTVGTVDYISPEQARDSGAADIRSDLYSLGCTWFHMLAGQTPFCEGGLAERLLKHMTTEPPDVRRFNPAVSDDLIRVLSKLLAKKPESRYQTPQELIQDLVSLNPVAKPLSKKTGSNGEADGAKTKVSRRSPSSVRRALGGAKKKSSKRSVGKDRLPPIVAGIACALVFVGIVAFVLFRGGDSRPAVKGSDQGDTKITPVGPVAVTPINPDTTPDITKPPDPLNPTPIASKYKYPTLYKPGAAVDVAAMRQEFEKPWAAIAAIPADAPIVQVSRVAGPETGKNFTNLAAAFHAAPAGRTTIVEIRDNGPLFELPAVAIDRSIVVRAGKGFRPLLVWDVQRTIEDRKKANLKTEDGRSMALFEIQRGSLTLEGLDVVLQWPDRLVGRGALLQATDGDITATGCTFSLSGKSRDGVALARLSGSKPDAGRCKLTRCYGRGAPLVVLDMEHSCGEALIDRCLFVGGVPTLIQARAINEKPTTIRTVRSTLVCGQDLLVVQPTTPSVRNPAFVWMGWDSLYTRSSRQGGGEMVLIGDKASTQNMRWQALNCLYTGWDTLLTADQAIRSHQMSEWRVRWSRVEGDVAKSESWPMTSLADPAEIAPAFFRTAETPVAYAATTAPDGPLGCDLEQLPPGRESWLGLTYERFPTAPVEPLSDGAPPEIPFSTADVYQGEMLDLDKIVDLGQYLQQILQTKRFGPRVVLHLTGAGTKKTSPIVVSKGTSLVLYFETATGDKNSLSLQCLREPAARQALVELEDGSLDVIGGDLRLTQQTGAKGLSYLLKVQGGDLRLLRCRLQAAPTSVGGGNYRSLIHFQGSGNSTVDRARVVGMEKCILLSGQDAFQIDGIGNRVVANECLIVAGGNAFRFDLGKAFSGRANCQCSLSSTTVAARRSVVHLADVADAVVPLEPLVVQTSHCAFLSPFAGAKAGMLSYEGIALARGLVLWQGDGDGFGRRLFFQAAPAANVPEKAQDRVLWTALWGSSGDRLPVNDTGLPKSFDSGRWDEQLDRLVFQVPRNRTAPGVNLQKLGIKKRTP